MHASISSGFQECSGERVNNNVTETVSYTPPPKEDKPTVSEEESEVVSMATSESSDSLPQNQEWKWLKKEAEQIRDLQAKKEAELKQKYSTYIDSEPSFEFSPRKLNVPSNIAGIDRVVVRTESI